ncbi:STY0301 family protein [Chitinimonas sp. PSY-7]|uniref:STY0301 family protein n=1 Tax=Chitinimonas sp. PSY-7 TaxID=3459088 RepID=UPI00404022E2
MRKFAFLLMVLTAMSPALAFELNCPSSLSIKQRVDSLPQGWSSWSRAPSGQTGDPSSQETVAKIPVDRVELYAGVPSEANADDLPPLGGYGDGDRAKHRYSWDLSKEPNQQFYAACLYGHSDIRLVQALPQGVKKCTAVYIGNGPQLSLRCDKPGKR